MFYQLDPNTGASLRRAWQPLLHGEMRASATSVVNALAASLRQPSGLPFAGPALFFADRYRAFGREEDAEAAVEFLERGVTEAPAAMSLHGGLSQIGWVAAKLETILDVDVDEVCSPVDQAILGVLDKPGWDESYDLMRGLVGFGAYFVSRLPNQSAARGIRKVLLHLEALSEETALGRTWRTAPRFGTPWFSPLAPDGWYDLGVAHGVGGVVALLGQAYAAGVERERARRLADSAVRWLLSHRIPMEKGGGLPYVVLPDGSCRYGADGRVAWCYGELGVSVALLGAALQFQRPEWITAAIELGRIAAGKSFEESHVVDAGLCHGAGGNAHLFHRLYQRTGEEVFRSSAELYYAKALELTGEGERLGTHSFWRCETLDSPPRWMPDGTFLEGASGLGLALLSGLCDIEPAWDGLLVP